GIKIAVADFEQDALERTARRPRHRNPCGKLERSVVAGAVETAVRDVGNDGAAQVRTLLVECEVVLRTGADEDADVVRLGVLEDERASERNRIRTRDLLRRRLAL